jgi:acyl carrier protein
MNRDEFLRHLEDVMNVDVGTLNLDTEIEGLEDWGSLASLSVISVVDETYGVTLDGTDIGNCITFGDLLNLVSERAGKS